MEQMTTSLDAMSFLYAFGEYRDAKPNAAVHTPVPGINTRHDSSGSIGQDATHRTSSDPRFSGASIHVAGVHTQQYARMQDQFTRALQGSLLHLVCHLLKLAISFSYKHTHRGLQHACACGIFRNLA
jgi:hypothetical protein